MAALSFAPDNASRRSRQSSYPRVTPSWHRIGGTVTRGGETSGLAVLRGGSEWSDLPALLPAPPTPSSDGGEDDDVDDDGDVAPPRPPRSPPPAADGRRPSGVAVDLPRFTLADDGGGGGYSSSSFPITMS